MINVLICDDDKTITDKVLGLVKKIDKARSINFDITIKNSGDFILTEKKPYDIAIVDIEMPGIGGLELASRLKDINPDTIVMVLTSFPDYLDSAMKIQVFRYLSKPVDETRFTNNFIDALEHYKEICKLILVENAYEVFAIKTKDILYIENKKHGSIIRTKTDSFTTKKKPQEWINIINQPNCFVYSHSSYIVNLQNVTNFSKTTVVFCDEIEVPCISQRRYVDFKKAFFDFAGGIK